MSLLQKQQKAFAAQMASASSKITKRTLPVTNSTAPSQTLPNKRNVTDQPNGQRPPAPAPPKATNTVYSQPADTGKGVDIQTNVVYARDYLKEKDRALSLEEILSYLSLLSAEQAFKDALAAILRRHPQVVYNATDNGGRGSYRFRPKLDVRNTEELLATLQSQATFKGILVKDLKEGWPDCEAGIAELEAQHKVLVARNKREATARIVWSDDPSLAMTVDDEFTAIWSAISLPTNHQQVIDELVNLGQAPAGKVRKKAAVNTGTGQKKVKKQRRGGKTTNKHMVGVLKDYSHLRR